MAISDAFRPHPMAGEIKEIVCDNSYGKYQMTRRLTEKLEEIELSAIRGAIAIMITDLYEDAEEDLTRDLAKVVLVGDGMSVSRKERESLLRIFYWIVENYFHGDRGLILEACRKAYHPQS